MFLARRLALAALTCVMISVLTFIIIRLPPGDFVDAYIANLAVGRWLQLPNTRIRLVLPPAPQQGSTGPEAIVVAWSGGTVDTQRNRLIVWGGGHNDYWGNEVYAVDLPSLSIQRIVDPSPQTSQSANQSALPDGTPTSRHTYDGLTYAANFDQFVAVGGAVAPNGGTDKATWIYEFGARRWTQAVANSPFRLGDYGLIAEYDSVTGLVYVRDNYNLYSYNPNTRTYSAKIGTEGAIDYRLTGAIDTKRRKFVLVGNGVQLVDLVTGTLTTMSTTNAPAFVGSTQSLPPGRTPESPGAAYDPVADRIVCWHGGSNVYALNMDTGAWTQVAIGAGPASSAPTQGTFGRWGYVPALRVFVLVNSIDENAWVFRLTT